MENKMKTMNILFGLLLLATNCDGREYALNPDRFPSLGFNFSDMSLAGARTELDGPSAALNRSMGGPLKKSINSYGADFRLPLNDGITLNLNVDRVEYWSKFTRQGQIHSDSDSADGFRYGFGLRIYFNK